MNRLLLLPLLLILTTCSECYAGYTVHVEQLQPEYVTVNGPYGTESWPNPERPTVKLPTYGAELCRPDNYSVHSLDAGRRTHVFQDSAGEASDTEVFAACPELKESRRVLIRAEGSRRLTALAGSYSPAERETWANQQKEAEEWVADPGTPTPMLDAMAAGRGISKAVLVEKINENVALFRAASGAILGQQQRLLDRIDAAATIADLLAIGWGD